METLRFNIKLDTDYQNVAPKVTVMFNGKNKFDSLLNSNTTIVFDGKIQERNDLIIERQNKPDNEKQDLFIRAISIDEIDLRNVIWSKSTFLNTDGKRIIGETWLGLNGTWSLQFTGPFWKYMMDWVNADV